MHWENIHKIVGSAITDEQLDAAYAKWQVKNAKLTKMLPVRKVADGLIPSPSDHNVANAIELARAAFFAQMPEPEVNGIPYHEIVANYVNLRDRCQACVRYNLKPANGTIDELRKQCDIWGARCTLVERNTVIIDNTRVLRSDSEKIYSMFKKWDEWALKMHDPANMPDELRPFLPHCIKKKQRWIHARWDFDLFFKNIMNPHKALAYASDPHVFFLTEAERTCVCAFNGTRWVNLGWSNNVNRKKFRCTAIPGSWGYSSMRIRTAYSEYPIDGYSLHSADSTFDIGYT